ncbi:hypothetical protein [Sphingomonas sp.]|uniref:hypothetical protein n=1 Tax=Sphingomonas sp. TaxID=28214 RepID=UPI0017CECBA1|nr:hypothetical protein [Sphingomonas sp.]MBA4763586.1 hypothetical protein [Sphingomonas sp.]
MTNWHFIIVAIIFSGLIIGSSIVIFGRDNINKIETRFGGRPSKIKDGQHIAGIPLIGGKSIPRIAFILYGLSVFGLLYSAFPTAETVPLAVAIGLFVMATTIQLIDIQQKTDIANKSYLTELFAVQNSIERTVRSSQSFYDEGNSLTAQDEVKSRCSRAIAIKNMFVPFPSATDSPYPLLSENRISSFEAFFSSPRSQVLTEILPAQIYFSKVGKDYNTRMTELVYEYNKKAGSGWFSSKEYQALVLPAPLPIINFVIFYYENSSKEVFFGWGGFGGNAPTKVYSSTNSDAVQMFEDYYSTLSRVAGRVSDRNSLASRLDLYLGYWLDVAIQVDNRSGTRNLSNAAVLKFVLDSSGRLAVRGVSFDIINGALTGDLHAVFRSTSCEIKNSKVFVSHDTLKDFDDLESRSSGKTTYDFKFYHTVQYFRGTITSFRRASTEGRFLETVGTKILNEKLIDAIDNKWGDHQALYKLVSKNMSDLIEFSKTQFSRNNWEDGEVSAGRRVDMSSEILEQHSNNIPEI